jgi:hypothetical protein
MSSWVIHQNGERLGPYSTAEVFGLWRDSRLSPFDRVRYADNSEGWVATAWVKVFGSGCQATPVKSARKRAGRLVERWLYTRSVGLSVFTLFVYLRWPLLSLISYLLWHLAEIAEKEISYRASCRAR